MPGQEKNPSIPTRDLSLTPMCPNCGNTSPPRVEPKGTYCSNSLCGFKLEGCCEGSPLMGPYTRDIF